MLAVSKSPQVASQAMEPMMDVLGCGLEFCGFVPEQGKDAKLKLVKILLRQAKVVCVDVKVMTGKGNALE